MDGQYMTMDRETNQMKEIDEKKNGMVRSITKRSHQVMVP